MDALVRAAAYVTVVILFAVGVWRAETTSDDAAATARRLDRQVELEVAGQCVRAWSGREQTRDMAESVYRHVAETLASFASDEERVAAYLAKVEADIADIRAELPDPECDLTTARRIIDKE